MSEKIMELAGVTKGFKRANPPVLDELNLSVPAGTVMGLLGKNGTGKTTLLKCALGLLRLQGGRATVFGEDSWDLSPASKGQLGYVPQEIALYPWMTARQVMAYTASFYPKWNQALAQRLGERLEINTETKVGKLSPGELQRLGILLAMGHEPRLLVLDEPAASLDPVGRRDFLRMLLEIIGQGGGERTVLFSTHITSDLERVADRVAILKGGKIDYCGELDELKDQVKRLCVYPKDPGGALPEITGVEGRTAHSTLRAAVWHPNDLLPGAGALPGVEGGRTYPPAEPGAKPAERSRALPGTLPGAIPGVIRRERGEGREIWTVRGAGPELVAAIEARWPVRVEVEDLNLEDIFLELHHA
ncbi:MAG: ABC transporter ATP-binding protein [Phycisphaeraceae bacterium]|nr:ABC transporter ATP-binding protein [Phycisphaeraceae bacterium]